VPHQRVDLNQPVGRHYFGTAGASAIRNAHRAERQLCLKQQIDCET
jgi:hypothetical protein